MTPAAAPSHRALGFLPGVAMPSLVRPLARSYRRKMLPATTADREERREEEGYTLRAQGWTGLVLPEATAGAPRAEAGIGPASIQAVLGQRDPKLALEVYTRHSTGMSRTATKAIGRLLTRKEGGPTPDNSPDYSPEGFANGSLEWKTERKREI